MTVLNPDGPWVWILYALAGAAVSVIFSPRIMNHAEPSDFVDYRDTGPRHVMHVMVWLFWPLVAAAGVVRLVRRAFAAARGRG